MHKLLLFKVIVSVTSPKNPILSVLMLDRFLLLKSYFFSLRLIYLFPHLEFEELSKCHLFIIVGCVTNSTNKSTKM